MLVGEGLNKGLASGLLGSVLLHAKLQLSPLPSAIAVTMQ